MDEPESQTRWFQLVHIAHMQSGNRLSPRKGSEHHLGRDLVTNQLSVTRPANSGR